MSRGDPLRVRDYLEHIATESGNGPLWGGCGHDGIFPSPRSPYFRSNFHFR